MDVEKNKIIETIKLSHDYSGVASDGSRLFISCVSKSTLVNRNDNSQKILKSIKTNRIALFNGKIYGTYNRQNKV